MQPMYVWQWEELAEWIQKNAKFWWNDKLEELALPESLLAVFR